MQVEAPAKQNHFGCYHYQQAKLCDRGCSLYKGCHTRRCTRNMTKVKLIQTFTASIPCPLEWTGLKVWVLTTAYTRYQTYHFCLDKSALLCHFPHSTFILDLTVSLWCNKAHTVFSPSTDWISASLSTSNEKPLKWLRKPSNHQLLSNRR